MSDSNNPSVPSRDDDSSSTTEGITDSSPVSSQELANAQVHIGATGCANDRVRITNIPSRDELRNDPDQRHAFKTQGNL